VILQFLVKKKTHLDIGKYRLGVCVWIHGEFDKITVSHLDFVKNTVVSNMHEV
jgi:hypothetical protein